VGNELDHDVDTTVSSPSPELKRLEPLLGRWQTRAQTDHTIFGPGGHERRGVLLARRGLLSRADRRTLTFVGPARFEYDLDATGKVETNGDGTITVKWWLRDESGEFKPWMNNVFRRVNEAAHPV